jgi:shikimate dehydrogenase
VSPPARTRAAVLGKPIQHSLSPTLHNAGYAATGLAAWTYTAIDCAESELADLVGHLGPEWAGLSLTMPLKQIALAVADLVSPLAAAIGAANTLVRRPDGSWRADNTDAPGMVDALRAAGVVSMSSMAILGAGGTARAAVAAAKEFGLEEVRVFARRSEAVDAMRPCADQLGVVLTHVDWDQSGTCAESDLVVSTMPKGVADSVNPAWRASTVLFDALYDPWPTPLAAEAAAAGCRIVSGLDLLLYQAARQFTMFTGIDAPLAEMAASLAAR